MREIGEMTKEQERERLNREIWAVAEGLRGIIDGWDFIAARCGGENGGQQGV